MVRAGQAGEVVRMVFGLVEAVGALVLGLVVVLAMEEAVLEGSSVEVGAVVRAAQSSAADLEGEQMVAASVCQSYVPSLQEYLWSASATACGASYAPVFASRPE
jgi:hypothetical protein